jgi:hypothetical protein
VLYVSIISYKYFILNNNNNDSLFLPIASIG